MYLLFLGLGCGGDYHHQSGFPVGILFFQKWKKSPAEKRLGQIHASAEIHLRRKEIPHGQIVILIYDPEMLSI